MTKAKQGLESKDCERREPDEMEIIALEVTPEMRIAGAVALETLARRARNSDRRGRLAQAAYVYSCMRKALYQSQFSGGLFEGDKLARNLLRRFAQQVGRADQI